MWLSQAVGNFLEDLSLKSNSSRHTIKNYDHHLRRFWEHTGEIEVSNITLTQITAFAKTLKKSDLKKTTQNYSLIVLRSFLQYLEKNSIPSISPTKVSLTNFYARQSNLIQSERLREVIEAPDTTKKEGLRDRCILEILYCTGLRVWALTRLNRVDIDLTNQTLQDNPLSDSAIMWLETYLKSRQDTFKPLFIRFQGRVDLSENGEEMRLTERSIERIVQKYATALNLKLTPEIFRQHFGHELAEHGIDLKTVSKKLGHKNTVTTREFLKAAEN